MVGRARTAIRLIALALLHRPQQLLHAPGECSTMQQAVSAAAVPMEDVFELGAAAALASVAAAAAQPAAGQQRQRERVPACPTASLCSFNASLLSLIHI